MWLGHVICWSLGALWSLISLVFAGFRCGHLVSLWPLDFFALDALDALDALYWCWCWCWCWFSLSQFSLWPLWPLTSLCSHFLHPFQSLVCLSLVVMWRVSLGAWFRLARSPKGTIQLSWRGKKRGKEVSEGKSMSECHAKHHALGVHKAKKGPSPWQLV